jgi:hypothetical protein
VDRQAVADHQPSLVDDAREQLSAGEVAPAAAAAIFRQAKRRPWRRAARNDSLEKRPEKIADAVRPC